MVTAAKKWNQTVAAMNQAATTASKAIPGWNMQAYQMLLNYAMTHQKPFCADMVRMWATQNGLPEPPSRLAWGGVFRRASVAGQIVKVDVSNYHYPTSKETHTQSVVFWKGV